MHQNQNIYKPVYKEVYLQIHSITIKRWCMSSIDRDVERYLQLSTAHGIPREIKWAAYGVLDEIRQKAIAEDGKYPGMLIVVGYAQKWGQYVNPMDDDLLASVEPQPKISDQQGKELLYASRTLDGAVLVDNKGYVLNTGMALEVVPKKAEKKVGGFPFTGPNAKGARHRYGIAASYFMQNGLSTTMVYALSEEDGHIRIFERGRVLYSPVREEIWQDKRAEEKQVPHRLLMPAAVGYN